MEHLTKLHGNCFLCSYAVESWQPAIQANASLIYFKKNEPLFRENEPVKGFYFIHSGQVKVHKQWGDEKELIIKFAGKMTILGHRGLGQDQTHPVSATAIEETEACFVTTGFFRTTLLVNPELAYQMVLFYANELRDAESGMRNMVHMDVKSRIADALLKMEEHFGTDDSGYIRCQLTRQDIASFSGTTYETLFKVLHDFTSENIVSSEGKRIRILRKEKLRQWVRIPECKNPEQGPRDLQSTEELNG